MNTDIVTVTRCLIFPQIIELFFFYTFFFIYEYKTTPYFQMKIKVKEPYSVVG
jgi:hypothetical protein